MSAEQMTSLMQRKARTGREVQAARAMSLGRALRLTAAKQAEQMMSLALSALGVTRKACGNEEIESSLDAASLILLMDGPGTQVAAAVLDHALVVGLIQQQTMGRIFPTPEGETPRAHTATDAAICAPFIEALLSRTAQLPEEEADRTLLSGYRFGVWALGPRQARLALDANDYQVVEMTLDMAGGARVGKLSLLLPEPVYAKPQVNPEQEATGSPAPTPTLAQNVLGLQADITIALSRFKMPLQKVSALKPGDLVNINVSSMAQALVIDASGRAISRGTLGQIDGVRALQVEQKKTNQYTEPRRRATDREYLDLPDVTAPNSLLNERRAEAPAPDFDLSEQPDYALPQMSEVDIFGDMDDLPDMPDIDDAAEAADAQMAKWQGQEDEESPEGHQKQAGW